MRTKYVLTNGDNQRKVIGIRYDDQKKVLLVGGSYRWNDDIWEVVEAFVPELSRRCGVSYAVEVNRMRVTVDAFGDVAWVKGIARLKGEWMFEKVRSFRRLMG